MLAALFAQGAPAPVPLPPVPLPDPTPTVSADVALGFVLLFVLLGAITFYFCRNDTAAERRDYFVGVCVGAVGSFAIMTLSGIGPFMKGILDAATNTNSMIPQPDWLPWDWNGRLLWILAIVSFGLLIAFLIGNPKRWSSRAEPQQQQPQRKTA